VIVAGAAAAVQLADQAALAPTPVIAPLFVVTPMLLGLGYYMLTQIARGPAASGTPGWYLHIMAGPLSLALVMGWRQRIILAALAAYALAYHACSGRCSSRSSAAARSRRVITNIPSSIWGNCFILPDRLAVLASRCWAVLLLAARLLRGLSRLCAGAMPLLLDGGGRCLSQRGKPSSD